MSKTIVITGASDGIGAAAARRLHASGHRMVVVGRSPDKTRAVADPIGAEHLTADFADLAQVRKLAADLDAACPRIDVLANNAGGVFGDRAKTVDGFERTFQVNHLAPFLLTRSLLDKLCTSRATVVQTSSAGHRVSGRLDLADLDHDRGFRTFRAYGAAKLENILFTRELDRRYRAAGIAAVAFHPGGVASNFGASSTNRLARLASRATPLRRFLRTPDQGADQLVWIAEGTPGVDWNPGTYYENHRPARRPDPQALDADLARRLWERSEELLAT